ncbi:MAG: hypothetical protein ACK5DE_02320 [Bacteroidota bacterium]|jgi:hypothetical protein
MPIPNYVRPQLTIEQLLQRTPDATTDRLSAVVIGREYLINRVGVTSNVYSVPFSATGYSGTGPTAGIPFKVYNSTTETYQNLDTATYTISADNTDLYIQNGEAIHLNLAQTDMDGGSPGVWRVKSEEDANVLVFYSSSGAKLVSSSTAELYSELDGRSVTVGDVFYVAEGSTATPRRRTVTAVTASEVTLSGPIVSSTAATPITVTNSATASGSAAVTLGSTSGLAVGQSLISLSGTASYYSAGTYISAVGSTGITLSAGVTAANGSTLTFSKLLYSLQSTLLVNENIDSAEYTVDTVNAQVSGISNPVVNVAEFNTADENRTLKDGYGKLMVSYRALRTPTATESLIAIETASDITDKLGTIDLENEIAFGANEAFSGSQGKTIYALRVSDDTTTAYSTALKKIEATDRVYALTPMTDKQTVQQLVATHCESMSQKDVKNFRRCYVGTDSPGEYAALSRYDGSVIEVDITVSNAGIVLDVATAGVNLQTVNLVEGDIVKMIDSNGNYTGAEYTISAVTDANTAYLSTGPASSQTEVFAEFWKADTPESQAAYVADVSEALGSRRAVNVWVENGTRIIDGVRTVIPNKYVAAEVAGLRSAVIPWQGLTLTEINSVTDAPAMYTRYTSSLLNTVAAAGTFIITQEAESGGVFIRHQLTTQSNEGSLAYEDSIGVSLDSVSFKIKDALNAFVGRKNVTRQTLEEIYDATWTILNDATTSSAIADYGPQLNGFTNKAGERNKIDVAAHPTLKDRVQVYARLLMPLPLNTLEVVLDASVDFAL